MTISRASAGHKLEPKAELGALAEWHREIQNRTRTVHDRDCLWRAAVAEAQARDYAALGVVSAANDYRMEAATILLQAYLAEEDVCTSSAA
jgi:hypothetical protein